jgi:hypothetical protein
MGHSLVDRSLRTHLGHLRRVCRRPPHLHPYPHLPQPGQCYHSLQYDTGIGWDLYIAMRRLDVSMYHLSFIFFVELFRFVGSANPLGRLDHSGDSRDDLVGLTELRREANRLTLSQFASFFTTFCSLRLAIGAKRIITKRPTHTTMPTDATDENGGPPSKAQGPPPLSSHSSEGSPSSSLIVARGRSRVRRISSDADPFSEENLRKRCVSVFGGEEQSNPVPSINLLLFRPFL